MCNTPTGNTLTHYCCGQGEGESSVFLSLFQKSTHNGVNQCSKDVTQAQQHRPVLTLLLYTPDVYVLWRSVCRGQCSRVCWPCARPSSQGWSIPSRTTVWVAWPPPTWCWRLPTPTTGTETSAPARVMYVHQSFSVCLFVCACLSACLCCQFVCPPMKLEAQLPGLSQQQQCTSAFTVLSFCKLV